MVINRKYEWKPAADKDEADRMRRNLQSFAQAGFKQIVETGSRTVGRGAREAAARLPGVEIAQELLKSAISSAAIAIPRQLDSLRGLTRLLPSTIRPTASVSEPDSARFPKPVVQEPLPLEVVEAPIASQEPGFADSPCTFEPVQTEPETDSHFDAEFGQADSEPDSPFDIESESPASPPDAPVNAESEETQCAFEFYDDQVPDVSSNDPAVEVDSHEHGKSAAQTARIAQEPPRTRFVARHLASQGYTESALTIYEQLLTKDPGNQKLKQEADEIRNNQAVYDSAIARPQSLPSVSRIGLRDDENRITSIESNRDELTVSWTITSEGVQRAQSVLGVPGELYLRIFEVSSDPDAIVRSTIVEHGPVQESGSWTARELSIDSRRAVAIGLRADQRFAAITHIAFPETSVLAD